MELTEKFFYDHLEDIVENTYQVLIKNKQIEDILDDETAVHIFLFNPAGGYPGIDVANDLFELLIDHYKEQEWYERCHLLKMEQEIDNITLF